eukprot:TRINITY_DN3052_c0_g2_i3.p1 TRINITY_DN3052_c0_g2~~TRINITY_DN3052_c0_g2_i3.p1  ORF type:complete len:248 (-),score=4.53 TRINITY_DN3052_c0_g2_i3:92-835(-)
MYTQVGRLASSIFMKATYVWFACVWNFKKYGLNSNKTNACFYGDIHLSQELIQYETTILLNIKLLIPQQLVLTLLSFISLLLHISYSNTNHNNDENNYNSNNDPFQGGSSNRVSNLNQSIVNPILSIQINQRPRFRIFQLNLKLRTDVDNQLQHRCCVPLIHSHQCYEIRICRREIGESTNKAVISSPWSTEDLVLPDSINPFSIIPVSSLINDVRKGFRLPVLRSCLLYTSPSPRDGLLSRMPSSA